VIEQYFLLSLADCSRGGSWTKEHTALLCLLQWLTLSSWQFKDCPSVWHNMVKHVVDQLILPSSSKVNSTFWRHVQLPAITCFSLSL